MARHSGSRPPPSSASTTLRSRRAAMLGVSALLIVVAAAVGTMKLRGLHPGGVHGRIAEPNRDQNVLIVTIDTLRADVLGTYGGRARTPNIDALASQRCKVDIAHAHG